MDNAHATQAGLPHPMALNVQHVLPDSPSMGMATVLFADWAANNARMAAGSVSPASKALLRTLMTAQSVTQCNRHDKLWYRMSRWQLQQWVGMSTLLPFLLDVFWSYVE